MIIFMLSKIEAAQISTETIGKLFSEYPGERVSMIENLGEAGKESGDYVVYLIKVMQTDTHPMVREKTARVLGSIGDPQAIKVLEKALHDKRPLVRRNAAESLGKIGEPRVAPLLTKMLEKEKNLDVCNSVVRALGELGDPVAVGNLNVILTEWIPEQELKEDIYKYIRSEAATALGNIGDIGAMKSLVTALGDDFYSVRAEASEALIKIGRPVKDIYIPLLKSGDTVLLEKAVNILVRIGESSDEILLTVLIQSDPEEKEYLTNIMRKIGKPAVEMLIRSLGNDEYFNIVSNILSQIGEPALEPLIGLIGHKDKRLKWRAVDILAQIGEPAVAPLILLLYDENRRTSSMAAGALVKIGDAAIEQLIESLKIPKAKNLKRDMLRRITGENPGADYRHWKKWHISINK